MDETRKLAEFVFNFRLDDCPQEVIHQAKRCTLETIACALGGSKTPLTAAAAKSRQRLGPGGHSTIVGLGLKGSPDHAAFINGVSANALDYDGGVVLQGHYGGTVIFSALAVAELTGATGRAFLEAIIAAYEVTTRIGEATRPSPEHRRLVSGYGPHQGFAAVVTAGRLLGLSVDQLVHAFGIYGTFAPLPSSAQWNWRNRPLAWTKDMVGWPSVSGINAAVLAKSGFLGPRTILEGDRSFWRMAASDRFAPEALLDQLGTRFNILQLYFKAFPTCRWNQAALDGLRAIISRRGWGVDEVESVEVGVARALIDQQFDDPEPRNLVDAQFSTPYAIAMILHGQQDSPDWYTSSLLESSAVRATMRKVQLRLDDDMERLFTQKRMAAAIVSTTGRDGTVETARVDHAHGDPENPLDDDELDMKFRSLARLTLDKENAERLLATIRSLDTVEDATELGRLAAGPPLAA